ncbi:leucine efflux protein LeuE [uncultured Sutterella sp.]|uniref:leucine efflux protein LeuE n=1 Tax=uncultured Sutterella sp. TaxID=286133 RepID=UPI00261FEC4E|nr:leucine efflux protein LeuE [uncultured Sutterella sp.]
MLEQFGILNPWIYTLGALMIVLAPGPNMLYVLKTSILEGRRAASASIAAVMIGDSVLIFLAYIGIAAAIKAHPMIFAWVKVGGGLYLAWLGGKVIWNTFFVKKKGEGKPAQIDAVGKATPKKGAVMKSFRTALALSLTNPKSILFYVSFFVQFIDESYAHTGISYLILALILQAISFTWFSLLVTVGADCLRLLARNPGVAKLGNTALGSLFLMFAGKLMLDA